MEPFDQAACFDQDRNPCLDRSNCHSVGLGQMVPGCVISRAIVLADGTFCSC
jgi:hypothetical protein